MQWSERTELLVKKEGIEKLRTSHVLIVGLGGVGAYAAEMLCRSGVGRLTIVDGDVVESSNINRQLPALNSTIGHPKAEILSERFKDINPEIKLTVINQYLKDEKIESLLDQHYDYIVDAIDTLAPKVYLIYNAVKRNHKIVSSMGAGGKTDPTAIKIDDISKSYNCKLAKNLRKRLKKLGIKKGIQVIFSPEDIDKMAIKHEESENKKSTVGTISYMPPAFGCFCASVVIKDLLA